MTISPQALLAAIKLNLIRRPLWTGQAAETILDLNRGELNRLLESGQVAWAWDLGTTARRKEVRILAASLVEHRLGELPAIGATRNLGLPEVVSLILPATRASLKSTELQRAFHCSPDLLHDLAAAGEIAKVKESLPRQGVNASPRFTRASLVELLRRRRLN